MDGAQDAPSLLRRALYSLEEHPALRKRGRRFQLHYAAPRSSGSFLTKEVFRLAEDLIRPFPGLTAANLQEAADCETRACESRSLGSWTTQVTARRASGDHVFALYALRQPARGPSSAPFPSSEEDSCATWACPSCAGPALPSEPPFRVVVNHSLSGKNMFYHQNSTLYSVLSLPHPLPHAHADC